MHRPAGSASDMTINDDDSTRGDDALGGGDEASLATTATAAAAAAAAPIASGEQIAPPPEGAEEVQERSMRPGKENASPNSEGDAQGLRDKEGDPASSTGGGRRRSVQWGSPPVSRTSSGQEYAE
jgi:hypothetical protein